MNDEKVFDVICSMQDNPDGDYTGFKKPLTPKQKPEFIMKAIQAFIFQASQGPEKGKIQAFSGSTDLPKLTKDVFNVTNAVVNYDLGWQKAYKGIKLKKGQLEWEIATVTSGFVFRLVPEGGKITFSGISGEKITVGIDKYGEGLGLTWEIIEGRKLYMFVDNLEMMRAALYTLWSDIHYGLLAAAAATNPIAWQGIATESNLVRDIQTINKVASTIRKATKDSGYGNTAKARLLLFASPDLEDRINAAMNATRSELVIGGAPQTAPITKGVDVEYTFTGQIPDNKFVMVLPGHKIQNAAYIQELMLKRTQIESLNEESAFWSMFGAIVADNDQTAEGSLA